MAESTQYKYDVFVSYHPDDQYWVDTKLFPKLKRAGFTYIDHKHFELGRAKLTEIEKAIRESRRTLLIISSSFLSNNWQNFESELVSIYGLVTNDWPAIPIIIDICNLPTRLQALVSVEIIDDDATDWKRLLDALKDPLPNDENLFFHEHSKNDQLDTKYQPVHNLPPRRKFINRKRERERVIKGIISENVPLVVIDGLGGMGKTVLAVDVAYDLINKNSKDAQGYFQFCVFVSAKSSTINFENLLDEIAKELNYPYIYQNTLPADKPKEVYQLLRNYRVLVIVDNFETIQDQKLREFIENIPDPSKAIITTRVFHGIKNPWRVSLEGLNLQDAISLVRYRAQGHDIQSIKKAQNQDIAPLISITGGNPLALETSIGYMKGAGIAFNSLVSTLSRGDDDVFDEIYSNSWSSLSSVQQELLMSVLFFVNSACKPALISINSLTNHSFNKAIAKLLSMCLVYVNDAIDESNQRYSLHPLTSAFLAKRMAENPEWEYSAKAKWANWHLKFALDHKGTDWWSDYVVDHKKLDNEWNNIIAAFEWLKINRLNNDLIGEFWLNDNVSEFIKTYGYWDTRLNWLKFLNQIATEQNDKAKVVLTAAGIIWTLTRMGGEKLLEEADVYAQKAWSYESDVSPEILCKLADDTSVLYVRKNTWQKAEIYFEKAFSLLEKANLSFEAYSRRKCHIIYYQAEFFQKTSKDDKAQELYEKGRKLALDGKWLRANIFFMNRLADIAIEAGDFDKALPLLEEGLSIAEKTHNIRVIALFKKSYATLEHKRGRNSLCKQYCTESLENLKRLGMQAEIDEINNLLNTIG